MEFLSLSVVVLLVIYVACAVVGAVKFLRDLHEFHPYKAQVDKLVKAHAYLKDIVEHEDYMQANDDKLSAETEESKDEICKP